MGVYAEKRVLLKNNSQIKTLSQPVEFFRNLILVAIENQKVIVNQEAEYYLVMLLVKYMRGEILRRSSKDPLAIKLHNAMLARKIKSVQILKEVGDFALYISGFFADSLNRKVVDIDYYIAIGGTAYCNLANTLSQEALQGLYKDLYNRFATYVDILSEVADYTFSHTHQDILRLYEKWLRTGSNRLEQLLKKEGIVPIADLHKKTQ